MGIKKSIQKLMKLPTEMRFSEARMVLEYYYGFRLLRSRGSHFSFGDGKDGLTIAVHSGKVKRGYLEKILQIIGKKFKNFS